MSHPRLAPSAGLSAAAAVVALLAAGCGNAVDAEVIGMTAVTLDASGHPVVLVRVCSDQVDQVEVFGPRDGLADDEPNPKVGSWTAQDPQDGTFEISVADPASPWTASGPIAFELREHYIVNASRSDADAETTQVDFEGSDLAALGSGQVLVRDSRVWSRDRFEEQACD